MSGKNFDRAEVREREHFDLLANKYDTNYGYGNEFTQYKIDKKIREFKKFISKNITKDAIRIIEFGCGTGEYTMRIAEAFPNAKIIALDISPRIIEAAKDKCAKFKNIKFVTKSAYSTGYPSGAFDVVCGFYFLHHVDLRRLALEISRLLDSKGVGFFYEPNILNPVVYLIKSCKFFKRIVGDSPDEWAINPIKIQEVFPDLRLETSTSEFMVPISAISYKWNRRIDDLTMGLKSVPFVKYLGGSVAIKIFKRR